MAAVFTTRSVTSVHGQQLQVSNGQKFKIIATVVAIFKFKLNCIYFSLFDIYLLYEKHLNETFFRSFVLIIVKNLRSQIFIYNDIDLRENPDKKIY